MKRWLSNIVEYSNEAMKIEGAEDSVEICPEIGRRVVFIPANTKDVKILNEKLIQLAEPFMIDTGTKVEKVTIDNYKEIDKTVVLTEIPEKYKEIEPIEIIKTKIL